jgi:signal transduction histidine kinase
MQDIIGAKTWMGKDVHSIFPKELAEKMIADDRRSLQAGYTVLEEDVPCADGKIRAYQTHKFAIPRAGMAPLLGAIAIDISERKQNEAELLAAKQAAEAASLSKSRFFAAASHDLRQPIHAQGLFLDILSRSGLNPQQQQSLDCAIAASQASAEMLNTMLDFSRIEAGVVQPHVVSFRLQPLLNKIEREFARQADAKGLVYRSRETALGADSDPALIELILRNLVSNAIRYTDAGGLLVACRKQHGQVLLEVWDTGIGIKAEHQREVFREFHQMGNPERDRRKGLGLGLSIVEGLARTLGHPLLLSSKPGRGSMFRLSLPLATGVCVNSTVVLAQHKEQLRNVRVLVVDDDEAVRIGTLHLLRDWGCVAEAAESIEEALVLASQHAPDVVVSDYRLREQRTGLQAIAALRSVFGQSLPALLITGDTAPDRLREALSGNIPLLHKPVSPDQLYLGLVTVLMK